jgi:hypothetical protein
MWLKIEEEAWSFQARQISDTMVYPIELPSSPNCDLVFCALEGDTPVMTAPTTSRSDTIVTRRPDAPLVGRRAMAIVG